MIRKINLDVQKQKEFEGNNEKFLDTIKEVNQNVDEGRLKIDEKYDDAVSYLLNEEPLYGIEPDNFRPTLVAASIFVKKD